MTTEERADEIADRVMLSYGLKGKKIREAVADAAQIGLEEPRYELDPKPWLTQVNAIAKVRTPWPAPDGYRYESVFAPGPEYSQRREDYP